MAAQGRSKTRYQSLRNVIRSTARKIVDDDHKDMPSNFKSSRIGGAVPNKR